MPVRYLNSPVLKWPSPAEVEEALRRWALLERERRPDLLRVGYFGSYARGDAGVGSDLDLVAVVRASEAPFERRAVDWDLSPLPVPAEILIYTRLEWENLMQTGTRFARMLQQEAVWL
ncbi:MAG: nucleotidyltransferase domain-containing protein [Gemmatimonadota bacterium]|nr:MAG: nucleotidyltransferase domain-containing protein [Gemmatimonadota bacterium]